MKGYMIFTTQMANMLLQLGFKLVKIEPHKKYLNTLIFVFEDSKEIRCVVSEIIANKK